MPPDSLGFTHAICRTPSPSVVDGLRAVDRGDPDYAALLREHEAYVAALRAAGVSVEVLPALDAFPDAVFVEDPALVFGEGAILLRPGVSSRAGETAALEPDLRARFAKVLAIADGTADGGDILVTPERVMIGLSARTDRAGAEATARCLAALGRDATIVETPAGVLHFKSDCALLDPETVLVTARLAASGVFAGFREIVVPDGEEAAANALRINDVVLVGRAYTRTQTALEAVGYRVVALDTTEIGKIDAGLSCMSLRWRAPSGVTA